MAQYNRNMMKRVNQKQNVQAVAPPRPAMMAYPPESPQDFKQEAKYGAYSPGLSPQGMANGKRSSGGSMGKGRASGGFSHKAPALATDMQCYFGCPETFKKDFDLRLHLKLRHKNEDPNELARAYQAAEEEIALVKRSGSTYECALCQKRFQDHGTFYDHTKEKHNMSWNDYKDKYGRCEIESAPFECKICGSVVKYTRNIVHCHLKMVHGLNWIKYLERIRKMKVGEQPEELPELQRYDCQICNSSVKYLKDHVWQVHRITEEEYEERIQKINRGEVPDELPMIDVFECKICNVTVKGLKEHIWGVHRLREEDYTDRVQKMERGEDPGQLPSVETTECKVCNMSVKHFREHLRHAHKITRAEYQELFAE